MVQQKNMSNCSSCGLQLQLKVNYCPFCGESQLSNTALVDIRSVDTPSAIVEAKPVAIVADAVEAVITTAAINTALVKHITKHTGKELHGIILKNIDLEQVRQYDRYAFKKNNGVFIRLTYLSKVPDDLLDTDQIALKRQNKFKPATDDVNGANITQAQDIKPVFTPPLPIKDPFVSPPPPKSTAPSNQINDPYVAVGNPVSPESSKSYVKYVIFLLIAIVVYLVFSVEKKNPTAVTSAPVITEAECSPEIVKQLTTLVKQRRLSSASDFVQNNQAECRTDAKFSELSTQTEIQFSAAQEKLKLAKQYLENAHFDMAETTLKSALKLDTELAGADELLQQIAEMKELTLNAQEADNLGALMNDIARTEQQELDNNSQAQAQAQAQAQRAEEEARQRREQEVAEQLKRAAAEAQKAAKLKAQKDDSYITNLVNADRALRAKNYGTAKQLAKQVLAQEPSNQRARIILQQAESGEARAFDDMVIE